tara:strand:- start:4500 stop:5075 length:576 start_codon:yes stop_codon:yes gene_type:complete
MANQKNVLNSLRTLLGMESELELLAEAILEDGTKIATDSEEFAEGSMAFVVSEDGEKMPLPSGSYATQDGVSMEVVDGEVVSISKEEAVEEAKAEDKKEEEEEMSSEIDLSAYATKEQLVEALGSLHTELSKMISKVVSENESLKEDLEKVSKMSAEKPVTHNQTNLSTEEVSYNTGNRALDMILKLKNAN